MIAPLDAFVAGQYYCFYTPPPQPANDPIDTLAYNIAGAPPGGGLGAANWVGASQDGFVLRSIMHGEHVTGDIWGRSVVDVVYQGGDMFLEWTSVAFRQGPVMAMWPWATLGAMGSIGRLGSVVSGAMVLVANPFTSAAGNPVLGQVTINSITAPNAMFAEDYDASIIFDSRLRRTRIRMRLLPYLDSVYNASSGGTPMYAGTNGSTLIGSVSPAATGGIPAASYSVISSPVYKWYAIM